MIEVYNQTDYVDELERIVLGSVISDKHVTETVLTNIITDDFKSEKNKILYNCFLRLYTSGKPIDFVTINQDLKSNNELNIVNISYVIECSNIIGSTANINDHVEYLKNESIKRQLTNFGQKIIQDSLRAEISSLDQLSEFSKFANDLINRIYFKKVVTFKDTVLETIDEVLKNDGKEMIGIKSGFTKFDTVTSGFSAPDFTIIAAGPGEGKSTFAMNISKNIALAGNEVLYFSLEMKEKQLIWKLLSDETNMSVMDVRLGRIPVDHSVRTKLVRAKLNIYDKGGISIDDICSIVKMEKSKKDIKIVFIDYLQLIRLGSFYRKVANRNDEVTIISNKLKQLAMDLNLPIVALSQLNRDKLRKTYTKADLRDSGALEQDADNIIFIFRPFEHDMDKYTIGYNPPIDCDEQTAIIKIDKGRLMRTGEFQMIFKGEYSRFEDLGQIQYNSDNYNTIININRNNEPTPF